MTWLSTFIRNINRPTPKRDAPESHHNPPECILTIWRKSNLSDGWQEALDGFQALSVKIVDGDDLFRTAEAKDLFSECRKMGLEPHGWGFHYCRTLDEAQSEAETVAAALKQHGINKYHWNAEKHWAGASNPVEAARKFVGVLRAAAPDVVLYANCFHKYMSPEVVEAFDIMEPMCYGTKISTIERHWKKRVGTMPPEKRGVMCGTGRMEKGRSSRAWGYLNSKRGNAGLVELTNTYSPVSVNWFRAGVISGQDMALEPNDVNPVLSEQAKAVRSCQSNA